MSLASLLPAPAHRPYQEASDDDLERAYSQMTTVAVSKKQPPPYGQRRNWIPRTQEDFGDGGAFPEIHVAQFPLDMGKTRNKGTSSALPVTLDSEGRVKYDALVRQGHSKDRVVHSRFQDLIPAQITKEDDPELQRPDDDEIAETTERTRLALEKEVSSKIAAAQPTHVPQQQGGAQYIRYTPSQQGLSFNSGAKQRVIRMVEAQKDPMEPPRFKTNKKIPRGPPSPPAPVMHSPNRKVTVKEQQDWKIPPCISNWKNAKGYTIPLDKRLAADGRGLQDPHINDKFAKLAEALYIADRQAREEVELRTQLEKKVAQREKEKQEEKLRKLAQKARESRAGIQSASEKSHDERERDQVRYERHKDREKERRIAKAAPDKRSKLQRDRERDITEKIALGIAGGGSQSHEAMYDQRLFNQNKGISSGFGEDDSYNVYDKPWRNSGSTANAVYRPSRNNDKDIYGDDIDKLMNTDKFQPDKEFAGTDRNVRRDGPVQFERDEEDPFGLDKFLTEAKKAGKRTADDPRGSRDADNRKRSKR
ncbi:SNW domain-containing protein 1-like [Dendronephthya gigantea]|uniref:SNW domain-containing protein 1-like n=1 Tax=Dendronephthya gigantea TaxID=151771 RepID=UPI00106C5DB2|nr:SNW domain-containing protein 1-like [Dendronephthya gigantea]